MRKVFLFSILVLMVSVQLFAQTIPNSGFETWVSGNPQGWQTTNQLTTNVTKDSIDVHGGKYAAKLVTAAEAIFSVPAAMTSGTENINVSTFSATPSGGFPYILRSQTFSGYYEYTPGTGDSCLMQAWLFKRNVSGNRDTIAWTTFKSPNTVSSYTLFSSDFNYHSGSIGNETPDSALIFICSAHILNTSAPKGSVLLVDDLAFSGNVATGLKNVKADNSTTISIYPNPASNEVTFKTNIPGVEKINVYDLLGKKIKTINVSSTITTFQVNDLNNGLYFYQLMDNREEILTTGRFSVKN